MKKKTLGRITALGIAALTAVPAFSIVASADITLPNAYRVQTGTTPTGAPIYTYYINQQAAANAGHNTGTTVYDIGVSSGATVYYDLNGMIYNYNPGNATAATWQGYTSSTSTVVSGVYVGDAYATDLVFYSSTTQRYYPNATAFRNDPANRNVPIPTGTVPRSSDKYDSTSYYYFDYKNGWYTNRPTDYTYQIIRFDNSYNNGYTGTTYNQYVIPSGYAYASSTSYYSLDTKTWYPNLAALREAVGYATTNYTTKVPSTYNRAYSSSNYYFDPTDGLYYSTSGGNRVVVSSGYTSTTYNYWYSSYTGKYYATYQEALTASKNNASYVRPVNSSDYYYYDDANYYYYYYLLGGYGGYGYTTTTKDTSKVTIGNLKGWTNVIRTINAAKVGSSYTVNMNTETEIPENVLKALKGKNVNISFKYSNGAIVTLNGSYITSTSAFSPTIRYGSTSIPSSLKKKAVKANNGVSSSQFTINGGSFGATASITVKFNSKRSGCGAKLYRYNSSDNSLALVSRSAVQSNGQCEFENVKQGGEYIVVLS